MRSANGRRIRTVYLATGGALCLWLGCRGVGFIVPPGQPSAGPGGSDYRHKAVETQRFGEGAAEYWIFTPSEPRPDEAPFVVFLHGWGGTNPRLYGAWIQHIVRKGHIVVFPTYQATSFTPAEQMVPAALQSVQDAFARLLASGPVRPRTGRIAWVGHSLGGLISAKLAAAYADQGLPPPAILMAVHPGGDSRLQVGPLDGLPTDTLVVLVVGDADRTVADRGAQAIRASLGRLPPENVALITIRSDDRGDEPLTADHLAPLASDGSFPPDARSAGDEAPDEPTQRSGPFRRRMRQRQADRFAPDALDYYGYWKLLDALLDTAFRGENRRYAFGGTAEQRFMGVYSDGVPVTPLEVAPSGP